MNDKTPYAISLSGAAIDVLYALFVHGPLFDGDVPSKSGRDDLVKFGLAVRHDGWQQLTRSGLELALNNGLDRKKEKQYREVRTGLNLLHAVRPILDPPVSASETGPEE